MFHHLLAERGDPYQLSAVLRFDSRARRTRLAAMQQVIDRHDILRTAFITQGMSSPVQVVWRKAELALSERRFDPADGPIWQQLAASFDPLQQRQDLTRAPLLNFTVTQEEDGSWCALQQWHHLIGDHSTLAFMEQEIGEILAGRGAQLGVAQPFRNAVAQARGSQRGGARKLPRHVGGYPRAGAAVRPERRARRRAANRLPLPRSFGAEPAVAATGAAAGRQLGQSVPPPGRRCWRASAGETRSCSAPYCWVACRAAKARNGHWVVYQHVAVASGHRSARRGDGGKRAHAG